MSDTLVVGDSLAVGTTPYLQRILGHHVDSDVVGGRSSASGIEALKAKLQHGSYRQIILDLGTNDATAEDLAHSIRQATHLAGDTQLYIPTLNGPFQTQEKNALLHHLASTNPNIHLIPWHGSRSVGADGIHTDGTGYQKRANLIASRLGQNPTVHPPSTSPSTGGGGSMAGSPLQQAILAQLMAGKPTNYLDAVQGT